MEEHKRKRRQSIKEHQEEAREGKPLWIRVFLIAILLGSCAMCVQQTYVLVMRYLSNPLETEIKMTLNDVMEFPAVTVCNMNPMRRSRWNKRIEELEKGEGQQQPVTADKENQDRRKRKEVEHYHLSPNAQNSMRSGHGTVDEAMQSRIRFGHGTVDEATQHVQRDDDTTTSQIRKIRQSGWGLSVQLQSVTDLVNANKEAIATLNGTIKELAAINGALSLNTSEAGAQLTRIIEELENIEVRPLELATNELEGRLKDVESNMTAFMGGMEATKRYLEALQANLTWSVNATESAIENKTSENVEQEELAKKKLPLSKDMEAFNDYLENVGKMTKEDIRTLGHQKDDFIALCTWKGSICNPRHFVAFQDVLYGNCFTFNTSQVDPIVRGTGPRNGLSLSLYIEQNEYLDRVAPAAGARVVIHDSDKEPFPEDQGLTVAAGQTTSIYLRKSTSVAVEPMCDPNVDDEERVYEDDGKIYRYSQKACINQCLFNGIIRQCRCVGRQFVVNTAARRCSQTNEEEEQCVQRLESLAKSNKLPCSCPASCRATTYNPMISSAIWPAEQYIPSFIEELVQVQHKVITWMRNISDISQFFSDNFLRVDIFFNELTEQEITQRHSYHFKRLISDIGGQLGLWIGVSVATLYEVLDGVSSLVNLLMRCCKWKARRTKRFRALSILEPPTNVARSYQVASHNSMTIPHWSLETTKSHETARFLRVHFEMDLDGDK